MVSGSIFALYSCNKDDDETLNPSYQEPNDNSVCIDCINDNRGEITNVHIDKLTEYLVNSKSSLNIDSLELLGTVKINDETVNWNILYGKRIDNDNIYYTYYYDETKQKLIGEGKLVYSCANGVATIICEINNSLLVRCSYNETTLSLHSSTSGVMTAPTLGDDIMECYMIAKMSCMQDPGCTTMCDFIGWNTCNAAFWLGCVGHHLKSSIVYVFI